MPQFVVLRHDWPMLHWDLMLKNGATLRSWRLSRPPDLDGPIEAISIPDHRLEYLTYEGPVSGGRGSVERCLAGELEILVETASVLEFRMRSPLGNWGGRLTLPPAPDLSHGERAGILCFSTIPEEPASPPRQID